MNLIKGWEEEIRKKEEGRQLFKIWGRKKGNFIRLKFRRDRGKFQSLKIGRTSPLSDGVEMLFFSNIQSQFMVTFIFWVLVCIYSLSYFKIRYVFQKLWNVLPHENAQNSVLWKISSVHNMDHFDYHSSWRIWAYSPGSVLRNHFKQGILSSGYKCKISLIWYLRKILFDVWGLTIVLKRTSFPQ